MCGSNGDCINQALDHACDCHDGFEVSALICTAVCRFRSWVLFICFVAVSQAVATGPGHQKCIEINDYAEDHEAEKCGEEKGTGTCGDGVNWYTCVCSVGYAAGYSTDGKPDGPKGCTVKCTDAGEFHGQEECKPVECGSPKYVDNVVFLEDTLTFGGTPLWMGPPLAAVCSPRAAWATAPFPRCECIRLPTYPAFPITLTIRRSGKYVNSRIR